MTALRIALVLVLAIAATVVANVILLGVATGSSEPVGKLSPRAGLIAGPVQRPLLQTRPAHRPVDLGERSDD